ncbi:MAG: aminoacyl-tRNA hydrolase [Candidatus Rokubacteria bacterium]|nr:aminoacyl-tRNA hydrolase [Candidatus Rokubacteria bacterium]
MSEPIVVSDAVRVPGHAIAMRAVRASGPGGQNVNKLATKVILEVDLDAIEGLAADQRQRLLVLARHRVDARGHLVVSSQATRTQARNLEDARDKIRGLVHAALKRPRRRRPTLPSGAAVERRIAEKKRRGEVKRLRRTEDG